MLNRLGQLLSASIGLVLMSLVIFLLIHLLPGDPALLKSSSNLGSEAGAAPADRAAREEAFRTRHGLDQPVLQQWTRWLSSVVSWPPDLGKELQSEQPVLPEIVRRLGVSAPLGFLALLIAFGLAIPLGFSSALHAHSRWDRILGTLLFGLYSLPIFWVGSTLMTLLCRQGFLDWFPLMGLTSDDREHLDTWGGFWDVVWHLTLPLACLSYGSLAYIARITRISILQNVHDLSVQAARARGVPNRWIWTRHIMRPSALPLITLMGSALPFLVSGSVVVETLFNLPGLGHYAWQGITKRDPNITLATTLLSAVLTWVGFRLADWGYAKLDPRVSPLRAER